MTLRLALFIVLIFAAPAWADLTNAEKAEAKKYYATHVFVANHANDCLSFAVQRHTDSDTVAPLAAIWDKHQQVLTQNIIAAALLLGANPYERGTAKYTAQEAKARSVWVTDSTTAAGAAIAAATAEQAAVDTAAAVRGKAADYYTQLTCVKNNLGAAKATISSVNRRLAYTDARVSAWWPRVVGPHGTAPKAMNLMATALLMVSDAMQFARQAYNTPALGEGLWTGSANGQPLHIFADFIQRANGRTMGNMMVVLFSYARIPLGPTQCADNDFHMIGRNLERLLSETSETGSRTPGAKSGQNFGLPYNYAVAIKTWQDGLFSGFATRPLAMAQYDAFFYRWVNSWRLSDGSAWNLYEFPVVPTLATLRAQAIQGSSQVAADPLCADATNPTTTLTFPVTSTTVRGTVALTATCTDNIICTKVKFKIDGVAGADVVQPNNGQSIYNGTTGNTTKGSPTVTNIPNHPGTWGLLVGQAISGSGIPANTTILSITQAGHDDPHSLVLSRNATATASGVALTVTYPTTYTSSWNTELETNGSHTIQVVGYDSNGNTGASSTITVTVANQDVIAPVIEIPAAKAAALLPSGVLIGATGTISLTATCTDNVGCVGVQWKLDGSNLGSETTRAPWTLSWNSTGVSNATHTLTAVARDAAGNTQTSAALTVKVNN